MVKLVRYVLGCLMSVKTESLLMLRLTPTKKIMMMQIFNEIIE
jgi:hypothetical protein